MKKLRTLLLLVIAGLTLVALTSWQARKLNLNVPFVRSRANAESAATSPANRHSEDRVAAYHGEQVTPSAEMAGRIEKLSVDEKALVSKGDLIAEIKVDDLKAALAEAKARLAEI